MIFKHLNNSDVPVIAAAIVGACRLGEWADPVQPRFLGAVFSSLFGFHDDFGTLPAAEIQHVKAAITSMRMREDMVEMMLAVELLAHPIPESLSDSIESWALALGVDNDDMLVTRETAHGAYKRAQADLYRHGYWGTMASHHPNFEALLERHGTKAFAVTMEPDPAEASRWSNLEHCASGSLGLATWGFYADHGFSFPGVVGAAAPRTAV